MKRLAIISHTEHYLQNGKLVGLNSTVTEINYLLEVFDEILHMAMLHPGAAPENTLTYCSDKINFIALPRVGGQTIKEKVKVLTNAPKILGIIKENIKNYDYFQFRAPTGIGVFVIPFLIASKKKGWFKYAGNWRTKNTSLSYRLQRFMLKNQRRVVTINGHFKFQPSHCLTFDNPCLTNKEYVEGEILRATKSLNRNSLNFCFVGRLESKKGIDLLINLFNSIEKDVSNRIQGVHIIGDGDIKKFQEQMKSSKVKFTFYGNLSREKVHSILQRCDSILLPSMSEGFPKVIAEALNYGCVPIVSKITAVSQFMDNSKMGFVVDSNITKDYLDALITFINLSDYNHRILIENGGADLERFTYEYYNKRIENLL